MLKTDFIKNNQHLFWYLNKNELPNISDAVLVEFILNYGNMQSVKDLLSILGEKKVAQEFSKAIQAKRNNYFPQVKNYFNLYFKHNVPQYPF
jgi:hypothetical protein